MTTLVARTNSDLREFLKPPHVRQLQESSVALRRSGPAGGRLDPAIDKVTLYTMFIHFEALALDSQHPNKPLP